AVRFSSRCTSASCLTSSTFLSSSFCFIVALHLLHVLQPVNDNARNSGNDLAIVRVIGRERRQHKLVSIRHFNVGDVMSRRAGPSSLGPQMHTFATLQCDAGEAVPLIVI